MAYYAAVISLKHTINRLLNSSHISILPSSRKIIEFAYEKVSSLEKVLEILDSSKNRLMVDLLREQIRDATHKLEDAIEYHISDQFLSRSERLGDDGSNSLIFSLDSDEVLKQEINYFTDLVTKMEDECNNPDLKLSNSLPEDDDADSLRNDFDGIESKMVGLSDVFNQIKDSLLDFFFDYKIVSISGMAGIGKTTLAKKIYQNPEICTLYDFRLWITVGPECGLRNIMLCILAQLNHDIRSIQMKEVEELGNDLCTSLNRGTFLIVLDDVWNEKVYGLERYLNECPCRVLLTTRLEHIAKEVRSIPDKHKVRFLNEEESWYLLCEKVFGEESCPPQLEKAGKKIAKNCDGLPLLIVAVAHLLSKAEKTLEYWNKVAEKKDKSIFINANDKISNILLRSYRYLPQEVKACFLYMGAFPAKCEIPASKLINLWTAEDLLDSDDESSKLLAKEHMYELASNNVVLAHHSPLDEVKTCSLHSSFWHACVRQSWKEKFLHVISNFADSSKEGVRIQRRLCIYNNALFGMKEVLDILSVRFYKFPIEVLKLIHLRYLALTYGGKVPASISKLWNLQYLIVHRHLNIKFRGDWSYLPVQIWNLQKLRHLQVMGSCLPYRRGAFLPNLLKLLGMSHHSCTREIFERIPNLQKLGIQIELAPDVAEPLSCFNHLSHLKKLESLKYVISNPNPAKPQLFIPPASTKTFPCRLKKLNLCGFGYPWEYMRVIANLPHLEVLKLRMYAFRGPIWVVNVGGFRKLRFLLLEDMDLVYFTANDRCFPSLRKLAIRHCYKLKMIPLNVQKLDLSIEIVDSPFLSVWRGQPDIRVHSSWLDGKVRA